MNYILFDDSNRSNLLPLAFTRPVCDFRIGILTIREKWEKYVNALTSTLTQDYLSKKHTLKIEKENLLINGSVCPNEDLLNEINELEQNQKLVDGDVLIAARVSDEILNEAIAEKIPLETLDVLKVKSQYDSLKIKKLWDIFQKNGEAIQADFELLTKNRKSQEVSETNQTLGENIFVEEGAKVECAILNSETGPIYIGKNAEVMEGAIIRGPFALCEGSVVKMGAKIYGPTTIGPYSKVGGEINNSVIFGYSNKAHDGFLGNSVIGEWCNLGADTNNSNLKNNYGEVKIWNYSSESYENSGLIFLGLIMGDHSKCGINTMFNTGTIIGVSANVFGGDFPPKFIPSFSWGGAVGFSEFDFEKACEVATRIMERRGKHFESLQRDILLNTFEQTKKHRYIP